MGTTKNKKNKTQTAASTCVCGNYLRCRNDFPQNEKDICLQRTIVNIKHKRNIFPFFWFRSANDDNGIGILENIFALHALLISDESDFFLSSAHSSADLLMENLNWFHSIPYLLHSICTRSSIGNVVELQSALRSTNGKKWLLDLLKDLHHSSWIHFRTRFRKSTWIGHHALEKWDIMWSRFLGNLIIINMSHYPIPPTPHDTLPLDALRWHINDKQFHQWTLSIKMFTNVCHWFND